MRTPRRRPGLRRSALAALLLTLSCSQRPVQNLASPLAPPVPDGEVVVLVPGITGVQLRDPANGEVLWGTGRNLLLPHDGGASLALPVVGEPARPLEAYAPLLEIRLGPFRKPVYGPLLAWFEEAGYRPGDLATPAAGSNLFAYSYDWRGDNVAAARRLASLLQRLSSRRGGSLGVDLVCQSNGGHICRYLAKYGDTSLEEALAGGGGPPAGVEVRRVILVGTSNGGSLRNLKFLNEGRRYVPFGRRIQPETLFTFPSLFQDLPCYRPDLFVDEQGRPLDVDLFDPASWRTYGWSVFGDEAQARLANGRNRELFATASDRFAFLERALLRARRLQQALRADAPGFRGSRSFLVQSVYRETADRALLVDEQGGWRTYFTGDRRLRRDDYLRALTSAPGDGHASGVSQTWLSPQELEALAAPAFHVDAPHFEMILLPTTGRRLVEILRGGPPP